MMADKTSPDWPASIAAVGLGLTAYPVGVERGFVPRAEAAEVLGREGENGLAAERRAEIAAKAQALIAEPKIAPLFSKASLAEVSLSGEIELPNGKRCAVAGRIEQSYIRRLQLLPPDTQLLVLTAAAEPLGDPVLLHRAAGTLGIDLADLAVTPIRNSRNELVGECKVAS